MKPEFIQRAVVDLVIALIAAVVIIFGWRVVHRNEMERDIVANRREMKIKYLIEAYRSLEHGGNRIITAQAASDLERAVADIQLFGSRNQVRLAQEFAKSFTTHREAPLDSLLFELRQSLRREIELEALDTEIVYLRVGIGALPDTNGH